MSEGSNYHAICLVLDDTEFFEVSLRSIYPHITGATVITSYDHDRFDRPVEPAPLVERLLNRELDPERKVNVIVCAEGSEGRLRNKAMAFAHPPRQALRLLAADRAQRWIVRPDYFWIVDADEIYDESSILRMKEFVRTHRGRSYLIGYDNYFRSWNWRIPAPGVTFALVRPGFWFGHLRQRYPRFRTKVVEKLMHEGLLPNELGHRILGARIIPRDVAFFHHGSYVGDRDRIATKLDRSGHRHEFVADWLTRVWDPWTPESRDLHPVKPAEWPTSQFVPSECLPSVITSHSWPSGWLDPG